MQHGVAGGQGKGLEGVAGGVAGVESLADALLLRVLSDDAGLDVDALGHEVVEL